MVANDSVLCIAAPTGRRDLPRAARHLPRSFEHLRALASLTAGGMLLLLVFGVLAAPSLGVERFLLDHSAEEILAAVVGFYFGSRS